MWPGLDSGGQADVSTPASALCSAPLASTLHTHQLRHADTTFQIQHRHHNKRQQSSFEEVVIQLRALRCLCMAEHHSEESLQDVKIKSVRQFVPLAVMEMEQVEDFEEPKPSVGPVPQYFPGSFTSKIIHIPSSFLSLKHLKIYYAFAYSMH